MPSLLLGMSTLGLEFESPQRSQFRLSSSRILLSIEIDLRMRLLAADGGAVPIGTLRPYPQAVQRPAKKAMAYRHQHVLSMRSRDHGNAQTLHNQLCGTHL